MNDPKIKHIELYSQAPERQLQGPASVVIRPGPFQALVDQIRTRSLGHLAGGVHRNRRGFFNVYYGVEGFPRFASRLR